MDSIVTYELSKHYHGRSALSRVTLQVPPGSLLSCVGPVGSGKTTLIRLLSGLYRPSAGDCLVLGLSPFYEADKLHTVVGTVLSSAKLYENRTISENLHFFSGLNAVEENDAIDRLSFLLHRLDLWESRDALAGSVTTAVEQRAFLARALMHRPQVLLLDAPDYDRETSEAVRSLLQYLQREEGLTVLLCTEEMRFAESFCDGFFLLRQGELIARGSLEELRVGAEVNCRALIKLRGGELPPDGFLCAGDGWQKEIKNEEELATIVADLVQAGNHLYEARVLHPDLTEIYAAYCAGGKHRAGETNEQSRQGE